ncbi:MAG: ankyrin repeat domain-containing protein, partial [Burkholderiales bacterium]
MNEPVSVSADKLELETQDMLKTLDYSPDQLLHTLLSEKETFCKAYDKNGNTYLHLAVRHLKDDPTLTEKINVLVNHGADLKATNEEGKTALHMVAEARDQNENSYRIFSHLVKWAAVDLQFDFNTRDKSGRTILHYCAEYFSRNGKGKINSNVSTLLKEVSWDRLDINARSKSGFTPVLLAA